MNIVVITKAPPETDRTAETDEAGSEPRGSDETVGAEARRPMRLVLARHAVTAHTGPLLSGRMPGIPLSEQGRAQAEALGERLARLPVTAVYASPIERTTETAEAVAIRHGLDVRPLPGVLEADYGEWTGRKLSDLAQTETWKVVQRAPSRASFPGGESLFAMQARMVAALDAVVAAHDGELVVVVSHADPIKAAIAHYTGLHLDLFQRIVISPASASVLAFGRHEVSMLKCNDTGSLDELIPGDHDAEQPSDRGSGIPDRSERDHDAEREQQDDV